MKAQEKLYGNAWQKCTKAHYVIVRPLSTVGYTSVELSAVDWSKTH